MLSDKGNWCIYVDRFWGQVLRKYLRGTQGRPKLCFGGFSTYGEPKRPVSLMFVLSARSSIVTNVLMPTLVGNKLFIRRYMMETH